MNDLDAIKAENAIRRAIHAKTTRGTWYYKADQVGTDLLPPSYKGGTALCSLHQQVGIAGEQLHDKKSNGEFIAYAHNDNAPDVIEALVAEVEALRAEGKK